MNWFVFANGVLYVAGAVRSGMHHNWAWCGVWLAYGVSAFLLAWLEGK